MTQDSESQETTATAEGAERRSTTDVINKVNPSVTTIRVRGRDGEELGIGTGFVVDKNGLIATNFHVINEGRPFTVESAAGKELPVVAVEASDVKNDLALIRVDNQSAKIPALPLAEAEQAVQGMRVLAFGNPHGLRNSVVEGIVSARQDVEGQELLQLAMPIDPGNSGGPLVDDQGRVHGIVNMKSAVDENLGFAIPVERLAALLQNRNPVTYTRWVRIGQVSENLWTPLMGALWRKRGGRITASGLGNGFGGRSLLLSKSTVPERPFEVSVNVRLDDESGAAGIVFHSDGDNRHYGFYPSGGRLRLSCFKGANVFSWQVLDEVASEHYLPGQWNHLKVRIEEDRILCFVNGHLVIKSNDQQLETGKVGLAKFRDTVPEFSQFQIGQDLPTPALTPEAKAALDQLLVPAMDVESNGSSLIDDLGKSGLLSARELKRRATLLEKQAEQLKQLAADVRRAETIDALSKLNAVPVEDQLLVGSLLIAKLDHPDLDIQSYRDQVQQMAREVQRHLDDSSSDKERRDALHQYLFQENGFHGSRSEYYHAANSHLNRVIDDREGLPITLSVLYIEIGRRIGLQVDGIGLPGHFVVAVNDQDGNQQLVDVFERGKLMSRRDVELQVAMYARREIREFDLQPNTTTAILTRILNNLIGIASRKNDGESMLRYCDAITTINPKQTQYKLMRAQLRGMTGRLTLAIQEVTELLDMDDTDKEDLDLDRDLAQRLYDALLERQSQSK